MCLSVSVVVVDSYVIFWYGLVVGSYVLSVRVLVVGCSVSLW
jgi:hypothetical protein